MGAAPCFVLIFSVDDTQITSVTSERKDNAGDPVTPESLEFHSDKHRKHMGMVYFKKGESSVDKLIQVRLR